MTTYFFKTQPSYLPVERHKSLKCDHIHKLCLCSLDKQAYLINDAKRMTGGVSFSRSRLVMQINIMD